MRTVERASPGRSEGGGEPVPGSFAAAVAKLRRSAPLVVQPRMGLSSPEEMRRGLAATAQARAATVGTITLDSYTRVKEYAAAERALAEGTGLNGYPIVSHGPATTRAVLEGIRSSDFPVQIRHGSPLPDDIFAALVEAGVDATEGGPVSYCLPYSRVPLRTATENWARSCERLAEIRGQGLEPHVESFGGCMMGQMCPPSVLIAITVLEGLFFRRHGIRSLSLSYSQQTSPEQDEEGLTALRNVAAELLSDVDWHIVLYTYMGKYPQTADGSMQLLREAAELAVRTGADRLIVKTAAESRRIPTIEENVEALEFAGAAALQAASRRTGRVPDTGVEAESRLLIQAVLDLHPDVGKALVRAFAKGYLDVPYCLHADNQGRTRSYVDTDGTLRWASIGSLPIAGVSGRGHHRDVSSDELLDALSYVERKYDRPALKRAGTVTGPAPLEGRLRPQGTSPDRELE